jgi:hypothetical protein
MRTVCRALSCFMLASAVAAAQSNPVPFINQPLVPMTAAPGGPGFTLTVNGTEFVSTSVVNWNGTALATTFVTSSQLTATVPASNIAVPGTAAVTVMNPAPGGGVSNVMYFDVANQASSLVFSDFYGVFNSLPGSSIIAADFNGDGILDLASAVGVSEGGLLVIELGNGDGTFQAPVQYAVGRNPQALITADFNGDGKLDVAVANAQDNTVSILLGNGDGTFQAARSFTTANTPFSISSGDFNRDGKLDLSVACSGSGGNSGSISILLGNGDGTFQTHTDYTPPGGGLQSVNAMTLGDFNGDGKLDIALIDAEASELFILLGNGDGTFQFTSGAPIANGIWMLAADLNGDGNLDLVIAIDLPAGEIAVLMGNGDGTFQPAVEYSTGGGNPFEVVAGDFNADGKLDLAAGNANSSNVAILLGNGDGTLQSPLTFPTEAPGCVAGNFCNPWALTVGDFNGDGKTDLAAALVNTSNDLLVLLQGNWPALAAVPPSVDFGQQNVGTPSAPQAVTLTNTGNAIFDISSIGLTGANAGDFSQNNKCGPTLAPNASCQVNVAFTPTLPGSRIAAISITSGSFNHPIDVPLSGIGEGVVVSLMPPTVTFPNQYVGTSGLPQSVQLTNSGNATLTITSVTATPADFAPLSTCGSSLAPGASCSIGVFFDPTTSGTRNGTLTVTDSASDSPQTASLTGVGQDFSMTPSSSSSATVSPGQTANYTVSVVPDGGFNQTVLLSCGGAPSGSSCSVSPSSAVLNGSTPTPVTVTVTTTGTTASVARPSDSHPVEGGLALWLSVCVLPGLVVLGGLGAGSRNRRRLIQALVVACLVSFIVICSACGGGGSNGGGGGGGGGTPQGTYNLTVTGGFTSGSTALKHAVPLTLVVQ